MHAHQYIHVPIDHDIIIIIFLFLKNRHTKQKKKSGKHHTVWLDSYACTYTVALSPGPISLMIKKNYPGSVWWSLPPPSVRSTRPHLQGLWIFLGLTLDWMEGLYWWIGHCPISSLWANNRRGGLVRVDMHFGCRLQPAAPQGWAVVSPQQHPVLQRMIARIRICLLHHLFILAPWADISMISRHFP